MAIFLLLGLVHAYVQPLPLAKFAWKNGYLVESAYKISIGEGAKNVNSFVQTVSQIAETHAQQKRQRCNAAF
jgi:hypothetical protein